MEGKVEVSLSELMALIKFQEDTLKGATCFTGWRNGQQFNYYVVSQEFAKDEILKSKDEEIEYWKYKAENLIKKSENLEKDLKKMDAKKVTDFMDNFRKNHSVKLPWYKKFFN